MGSKRPTYTPEFRLEAVRLVVDEGLTASQVAQDLGIKRETLYLWMKKYRSEIEAKSSRPVSQEEELRRLRRDNRRLRMERDILKKAAAFFANESRSGTDS